MQNQEEIRQDKPIFKNPWKIFFWEAFLFSLTMIFGIFTGLRLGGFFAIKEVLPPIEISPPSPNFPDVRLPSAEPSFSLIQFLIYFLISIVFILFVIFIIKSKRIKKIIFEIIFILATGMGGLLALGVWYWSIITLVFIVLLIFIWLNTKSIFVHNLLLILGIIGMGSAVGLRMEPWTGVIILVIFSVYDYIAVYQTKHMIKMAKEMAEQGSILALIIPQKLSDFKASLTEVKPGGNFLILGGGDIAFPLLFSVAQIPQGIINSIIVAVFSLIGLFAGFLIFIKQKERRPIPALPPIALFSIIGFLITKLI